MRGNHTQSALLAGLGKLGALRAQVLAFPLQESRGRAPSWNAQRRPGTSGPCLYPPPGLLSPSTPLGRVVITSLISKTLLPSVQQRKMK